MTKEIDGPIIVCTCTPEECEACMRENCKVPDYIKIAMKKMDK